MPSGVIDIQDVGFGIRVKHVRFLLNSGTAGLYARVE